MTFRRCALNFVVLACLFPASLPASGGTHRCIPPNKRHLRPTALEKSNISERKFNEIIAAAEKVYAPIVRSHGAKLKIHRRWDDDTVNASAVQNGSLWEVNMYGGLARQPEVTPDGFALVVCHELGHHLGGYVMVGDEDMQWASNEGQSDYFATQSCAKEIWKAELEENAKHRATVLPTPKAVCDKNYGTVAEQDLCYRTSNAGLSLATLLASLRNSELPKFETPSRTRVDVTMDEHPEAQCRLDTYLAAAGCSVPFDPRVIPGKELSQGGASREAEDFAGQSSCLARDGWSSAQRPRCWFKPFFEFEGLLAGVGDWKDASRNGQAEPGETLALRVPLNNNWSKLSQQVVGEIFSLTSGVTVVQGKVSYPDIAPGKQTSPVAPFEIKVSKNFTCGHPFELLFRASSAQGSREFPFRWFTGPKVASDFVLERRTDPLAIEDYPSPGLNIPVVVKESLTTKMLELVVKIFSIYPEEIAISLVSPDGKEHTLKTEGDFDADNIARLKVTFPEPVNIKGRWFLKLRDTQENDTASLESFELRAPFAEKVNCQY
jgi:subtilisin-like proprotein convertase family protein